MPYYARSFLPSFKQISHSMLLQHVFLSSSIIKIDFVFKFLRDIYKTQMVIFHLLMWSNHSTFHFLGQFTYFAWTPVIAACSYI